MVLNKPGSLCLILLILSLSLPGSFAILEWLGQALGLTPPGGYYSQNSNFGLGNLGGFGNFGGFGRPRAGAGLSHGSGFSGSSGNGLSSNFHGGGWTGPSSSNYYRNYEGGLSGLLGSAFGPGGLFGNGVRGNSYNYARAGHFPVK